MTLVRTTFESEDAARALSRRLIEKQWACCVHMWRIDSTYFWEGKTHEGPEWMVEARVPSELAEDTWVRIMEAHPFDVPLVEIAAHTRVNGKYAQWARGVMGLQG